jgi:hypothetical protein
VGGKPSRGRRQVLDPRSGAEPSAPAESDEP